MLNVIVLVLLGVTMAIGLTVLLRWLKRRRPGTGFPTALVATHISVVVVGTALWVIFMATDQVAWAWASLVVVLTGNGLGDLVLAGRWRLDVAASGRWAQGWLSAVKDLVHPRRRINAAHAVLAGVTSVTMLVATLRAAL